MRLLLKIVAGVAGLLLLLLGAVAVVVATMDTRTLLVPIEAELERATGRDVTLGTEARIDLSLTPTLQLTDVAVGNAPWGSAKEMIRAKRLEAQVALLPLLSRRVDLVRFTLVEPTILLETDSQGRGNWTFGDSPAAPSKPADPVADAAGAFGLGEFAIERGDVRWRDGRTGEVTQIRIERLYLRARDPGKPVVAEFRGSVAEVPLVLEGHFGPLAALRAKQWPWPLSVKGEVAGRKTEVTTKVREVPDGLEASELVIAVGNTKMSGTLVYAARSPRPFVRFKLEADTLTPADLAIAGGAAATAATGRAPAVPAKAAAKPDGRLFSSTPIPLGGLSAVDAQGELAIGKLVLAAGRTAGSVRAKLTLADGRLEVSEFAGNVLGGSAQGQLVVDARNEKNASLALKLDARDLDLAALMAVAGVVRDVKGGKTEIHIDVNARGNSMRGFASTLNGSAVARVGNARWISTSAGMPAALDQLATVFNPLRTSGAPTDLKCVGLRLPFASGVARFDRGIGMETEQLGVAASGTINLGSESLDLLVHPRIKDRSGVDLARISGAVRIQGPLNAPRAAFNPVGSIAAAGDIAALARGGGRAALIGALTPTAPSGPSECAVALGTARAETPPAQAGRTPSPGPAKDPAQDLNRALGKLLGR
jgi:uncharacterized protein involved in outer membrane biogenesis